MEETPEADKHPLTGDVSPTHTEQYEAPLGADSSPPRGAQTHSDGSTTTSPEAFPSSPLTSLGATQAMSANDRRHNSSTPEQRANPIMETSWGSSPEEGTKEPDPPQTTVSTAKVDELIDLDTLEGERLQNMGKRFYGAYNALRMKNVTTSEMVHPLVKTMDQMARNPCPVVARALSALLQDTSWRTQCTANVSGYDALTIGELHTKWQGHSEAPGSTAFGSVPGMPEQIAFVPVNMIREHLLPSILMKQATQRALLDNAPESEEEPNVELTLDILSTYFGACSQHIKDPLAGQTSPSVDGKMAQEDSALQPEEIVSTRATLFTVKEKLLAVELQAKEALRTTDAAIQSILEPITTYVQHELPGNHTIRVAQANIAAKAVREAHHTLSASTVSLKRECLVLGAKVWDLQNERDSLRSEMRENAQKHVEQQQSEKNHLAEKILATLKEAQSANAKEAAAAALLSAERQKANELLLERIQAESLACLSRAEDMAKMSEPTLDKGITPTQREELERAISALELENSVLTEDINIANMRFLLVPPKIQEAILATDLTITKQCLIEKTRTFETTGIMPLKALCIHQMQDNELEPTAAGGTFQPTGGYVPIASLHRNQVLQQKLPRHKVLLDTAMKTRLLEARPASTGGTPLNDQGKIITGYADAVKATNQAKPGNKHAGHKVHASRKGSNPASKSVGTAEGSKKLKPNTPTKQTSSSPCETDSSDDDMGALAAKDKAAQAMAQQATAQRSNAKRQRDGTRRYTSRRGVKRKHLFPHQVPSDRHNGAALPGDGPAYEAIQKGVVDRLHSIRVQTLLHDCANGIPSKQDGFAMLQTGHPAERTNSGIEYLMLSDNQIEEINNSDKLNVHMTRESSEFVRYGVPIKGWSSAMYSRSLRREETSTSLERVPLHFKYEFLPGMGKTYLEVCQMLKRPGPSAKLPQLKRSYATWDSVAMQKIRPAELYLQHVHVPRTKQTHIRRDLEYACLTTSPIEGADIFHLEKTDNSPPTNMNACGSKFSEFLIESQTSYNGMMAGYKPRSGCEKLILHKLKNFIHESNDLTNKCEHILEHWVQKTHSKRLLHMCRSLSQHWGFPTCPILDPTPTPEMRDMRISNKTENVPVSEAVEAENNADLCESTFTKGPKIGTPNHSATEHQPATGHYVDTTGTVPDTNAADTDMAADNS
jgi:hypothetical protein